MEADMENDKLRIGYPTEKGKTICPYCRYENKIPGDTVECDQCGNKYIVKTGGYDGKV